MRHLITLGIAAVLYTLAPMPQSHAFVVNPSASMPALFLLASNGVPAPTARTPSRFLGRGR